MRLKARASSASWSMMGWACPMLLGLPTWNTGAAGPGAHQSGRLQARTGKCSGLQALAQPALTLMFLPPSITEFICSKASCAASGTSYSTKAKPWMQGSGGELGAPGTGQGGWAGGPHHLVLHGDRVPGHVDALDGAKRGEGLADRVLPQLIVDGAHVDPTHDGQCPLSLSCHLEQDRGETNRLVRGATGSAAHSLPGPPTKHHRGESSPRMARCRFGPQPQERGSPVGGQTDPARPPWQIAAARLASRWVGAGSVPSYPAPLQTGGKGPRPSPTAAKGRGGI